ncbi:sensor histidine kinase [Gelidibacter maritimus]|uniref:Histidine kinase n=1 Tax=Gelidibacter maritimus TaxID=2761487 RepID=A0A7W2R3C0_9FLAO|nr:histidine kinase [Gelidibacter maritimus]MBA6152473.1 histidine kinase [Gelidibacter maritimus]
MYIFKLRFGIFISALQEQTVNKEEIALIGYVTLVVVLLATMVIVFFVAFQKRKNKLLLEKVKQQKQFEETVAKTSEEIQEQTLKYLGEELHDNIGQLLSLASMQMGMLGVKITPDIKEPFTETQKIIRESLNEVRALSKSLNADVIQNRGFEKSINAEIVRLNRMKLITAEFVVLGEVTPFKNKKDGIILFRILQEFISNTVKHSKAKVLQILLDYRQDAMLIIKAADDGQGFDLDAVKDSSGLLNMKNRAELTESTFSFSSQPNNGTQLEIHYPIEERALKRDAIG